VTSVFAALHGAAQTEIDARHGEPFRLVPRANRQPDPARPEGLLPVTGVWHEAAADSRHEMNGKVPGLSVPPLAAKTRLIVISLQRGAIPTLWRSAAAPYGLRRGDHLVRVEDDSAWAIEDVIPAGPSRLDFRVLEAREPA